METYCQSASWTDVHGRQIVTSMNLPISPPFKTAILKFNGGSVLTMQDRATNSAAAPFSDPSFWR